MKIVEISSEQILFDNGSSITFDHEQDCCEYNYADFEQLDDIGKKADFNTDLLFEEADDGFRFGDKKNGLFFIPCYSQQNGYYTNAVDIYYNGELKVATCGEGLYD